MRDVHALTIRWTISASCLALVVVLACGLEKAGSAPEGRAGASAAGAGETQPVEGDRTPPIPGATATSTGAAPLVRALQEQGRALTAVVGSLERALEAIRREADERRARAAVPTVPCPQDAELKRDVRDLIARVDRLAESLARSRRSPPRERTETARPGEPPRK
jgi:hypothetical protein